MIIDNAQLPKGYKLTEIGVIPEDWDVKPVGEAFEIRNNLRLPISKSVRDSMKGQYPYYGPTNIQDYINEYRVEGEHALIGEDGDHFLKWREIPMTLLVNGKFNVNNHAHIIRGTSNLTVWFYYFFIHRDLTPNLKRQGSGRFKLNKATLIQIPCAIPPLSEQKAIATVLSDTDALIAALDRLIAKKRDLKQATMQQLLTGKTRLPGFTGDWEVKRLGDVADTDPENLGSDTRPEFTFNYIALEDVDRGFLRSYTSLIFANAPSRARRILRINDVLVSTVRPNLQSHLLFKEEFDGWVCSTGFCVIRCREGFTHPGYVFCHLFGSYINRQIEALLTGSNYPAINSADVRALSIPIPEYKEQRAIAQVLSDMDAEIAALEQRRDKTRTLKQGMMQALLTGRIRLV